MFVAVYQSYLQLKIKKSSHASGENIIPYINSLYSFVSERDFYKEDKLFFYLHVPLDDNLKK